MLRAAKLWALSSVVSHYNAKTFIEQANRTQTFPSRARVIRTVSLFAR